MKWAKRRKLLRISKLLIPLCLAVSIVFAGFSVFADEAQNFVVKIKSNEGVSLALSIDENLANQSAKLLIPSDGNFTGATFDPETGCMYNVADREYDINNVTQGLGGTCQKDNVGDMVYYAFSFYLINNSTRAVDVDVSLTIDGLLSNGNETGYHVDDALRIMFIEGDTTLANNTNAYSIYAKRESSEEDDNVLRENEKYYNQVEYFASSDIIFERTGDDAILNFAAGDYRKFTIVMWLEGHDNSCADVLFGEMIKMSINFSGR